MRRADKLLPRALRAELQRIAHDEQLSSDQRAPWLGNRASERLHEMAMIRVWQTAEGKFCALSSIGRDYLKGKR